MKTITATNLRTEKVSLYRMPSRGQIIKNYDETKAEQWDAVERSKMFGGVPLVWERVTP